MSNAPKKQYVYLAFFNLPRDKSKGETPQGRVTVRGVFDTEAQAAALPPAKYEDARNIVPVFHGVDMGSGTGFTFDAPGDGEAPAQTDPAPPSSGPENPGA